MSDVQSMNADELQSGEFNPLKNEREIHITPKGIKKSRLPLKQRLQVISVRLRQMKYMIAFQKRKRGFGMMLGDLWLVLDPILRAGLYYFLINFIFQYKGMGGRFLMVFTCVSFWRFHSKLINAGPNIFYTNAGILKQTNFPYQMLFFETFIRETVLFGYNILALLAFYIVGGNYPQATWLYAPLIFMAQLSLSIALATLLSIVGTFIKDIKNVLFVGISIWWYTSPGIYDVDMLPEKYLYLFKMNPFYYIFPAYKNALVAGVAPDVMPLFLIVIICSVITALLFRVLARASYHFFQYL